MTASAPRETGDEVGGRRSNGDLEFLANLLLSLALPGCSLAPLGFVVPSKLPQASLEPRDSASSKRGLQLG